MLDLDILGKFLYAKFMYRKNLSIVTKNLQIIYDTIQSLLTIRKERNQNTLLNVVKHIERWIKKKKDMLEHHLKWMLGLDATKKL